MIVAKKTYSASSYVYGNHAYDYKDYETYKNEDKKTDKETSASHKSTVKRKLKLISTVIIMLLVGTLIVGRYALIMNLNSQSISLRKSISENQKLNDDLKLQLMKYCDITQIEEYASSQIQMVRPESYNIVYIDVSETYEVGETEKEKEDPQKVSFLGRIISFFEW